jgi:membrane associated rhomboid family serine protease
VDVINALLGINALVFAGWWLAPPRFMRENFVSTLRNLREVRCGGGGGALSIRHSCNMSHAQGRVWTLITPAFSHQSPMHLLFNRCVTVVPLPYGGLRLTLLTPHRFLSRCCTISMAMWVLGKEVMFVLGPSRTLLLYLAAGTHTHAPPLLHPA